LGGMVERPEIGTFEAYRRGPTITAQ
jgi:hypothetical protein